MMPGFPVLIAKDGAVSYIGIQYSSAATRIVVSMHNDRFLWTADSSDGETQIINSNYLLARMVCRTRSHVKQQDNFSGDAERLGTGLYVLLTTIFLDGSPDWVDTEVLIYP